MPYPLEDFYKATSQLRTQDKVYVDTDFSQLNKNTFDNSIPYISQMDNHSLFNLIKNSIDVIFNGIIKTNPSYIPLFEDPHFVSNFARVISSIPIDYTAKLACNKLIYDYFTSDNPNEVIKRQYLEMSRVVNRDDINKLMSIGLDTDTACNLALCRHSSANEKTNVKRLNFTIYKRNPEIMNEQTVVWIYEKLFSRISDLFTATMFETLYLEDSLDENFMENWGTVGLVVLLILNNMTSENIKKVLMAYASDWDFLGRPTVRFSLHALSQDYSRISRVVENLSAEGYIIP